MFINITVWHVCCKLCVECMHVIDVYKQITSSVVVAK